MLKKLMKHELRASANIMLPLFGVVILLSLGMAVMLRLDFGDNIVLNILSALISVGYAVSLGAVFIVVLVLMINRFRTNLLGDEGYVMFTLPVSVHQLIWSKIIISCFWFVCSTIVVLVSVFILAVDGNFFREMQVVFGDFFQYLNAYYAMHGVLYVIEVLLVFFVGYAASCLQFYASMAFGYSFDRHKILYSLGFYFGSQFAFQFIGSLVMVSSFFSGFMESMFIGVNGVAGVHTMLCLMLLATLVYGAIFYVFTTRFLQKRLNIE